MGDGKEGDGKRPAFTVSDRRTFAPGAEPGPPGPGAAAVGAGDAASTPPAADEPRSDGSTASAFPPVDFHTFILSLGSSALLHLGELDPPDGAPAQVDLPLAHHTIDVIAMLQEKTRGNLTAPEAELVESLLFDLRLRYMELSKSAKPG